MADLIVTREFPPQDGGIAVVAYEMAAHWSKNKRPIQVLCWNYVRGKWPSQFQDQDQTFSINRMDQPSARIVQIWALTVQIFKIHQREKIDRIWATSWNFSGVASCVFNFFTGVPYAVLTHGYEVSRPALSRTDIGLLKIVLKRAKRVFSVSHYTRDLVLKFIPKLQNVEFVPNGIDAEKFSPKVSGTLEFKKKFGLEGKKVLLTVARLFPRKGHDQVIDALPAILARVPTAHYLIVGEGPEKENLRQKVQKKNLQGSVTFAGFVQDRDLPVCYASCDIFILPNRVIDDPKDPWVGDFEGFGVAFIEASAAGKPVIGGNSGGVADAVIDGVTGFLVSPTNPQEIAEKACLLLEDPELARKIGLQGRQRVENELDWPMVLQKYEDAFDDH
ncbi:MAG: glycosyltransferase family 1 protein [Candidatus Omnitrophica bacterium]|nr:glycosyltransferase family 1 protein [Candidatus Omnitrophota bacterium]